MIRNAVVTVIVASAVAIFAPRDLRQAAVLSVRAGVALIKLGLTLYPPRYDAGAVEDNDGSDIKIQRTARAR